MTHYDPNTPAGRLTAFLLAHSDLAFHQLSDEQQAEYNRLYKEAGAAASRIVLGQSGLGVNNELHVQSNTLIASSTARMSVGPVRSETTIKDSIVSTAPDPRDLQIEQLKVQVRLANERADDWKLKVEEMLLTESHPSYEHYCTRCAAGTQMDDPDDIVHSYDCPLYQGKK